LRGAAGQLRMMTVRAEGQFNTVVYEDTDIYRGQDRRNVILMSREDVERLGLRPDQRVTVRSEVGSLSNILVRIFDIRAGNALMYFPEANVLAPTTTDPQSKTPAFKCVLVTVEPEGADDEAAAARAAGRRPLELVRT
jgi:anaerobic selenocysteine-containing dehydrogenase